MKYCLNQRRQKAQKRYLAFFQFILCIVFSVPLWFNSYTNQHPARSLFLPFNHAFQDFVIRFSSTQKRNLVEFLHVVESENPPEPLFLEPGVGIG